MRRWYGKLLGLVAGAALFRANPLLGGLIGMLLGHAFDADWFRLRRRDDPYRVLGLTEEVDEAELERAYRRLIAQYHPDRLSGAAPELRQQAERRAREINSAYDRIRALRQKRPKP
jgi:DnaJ-domain-containing protein 1